MGNKQFAGVLFRFRLLFLLINNYRSYRLEETFILGPFRFGHLPCIACFFSILGAFLGFESGRRRTYRRSSVYSFVFYFRLRSPAYICKNEDIRGCINNRFRRRHSLRGLYKFFHYAFSA